jgi:hypothetical protein
MKADRVTRPRESDVPARAPLRAAADAGLALAEQVTRLRPVIDNKARELGIDPETHASAIAVILRDQWQALQWADVSLEAGLPVPDLNVRWAVIRDYRERGFKLIDCFIVDPVRDGAR